jgi:hypothetical protein
MKISGMNYKNVILYIDSTPTVHTSVNVPVDPFNIGIVLMDFFSCTYTTTVYTRILLETHFYAYTGTLPSCLSL